jgi:hypothetical protein
MDPTYPVDPMSESRPDPAVVTARVLQQESLLSPYEDLLTASVIGATETQEETLKGVYRPLIRQIQSRIKLQGASLQTSAGRLADKVRGRLGGQAGALSAIMTKLPLELRPVPTPARRVGSVSTGTVGTGKESPTAFATASSVPLLPTSSVPPPPPPPPTGGYCVAPVFQPDGTVLCPSGYEYDPATALCCPMVSPPPPPPPPCPPGTVWDAVAGVCVTTSPPPPPPPPPPGVVCETPPPNTVQPLAFPWEWIPQFWFSYRCRIGCPIEVWKHTTYGGPPVGYIGVLVGPYNEMPTDEIIRQHIIDSGCLLQSPPPPPPPPPPPGVPPTVPPAVPPTVPTTTPPESLDGLPEIPAYPGAGLNWLTHDVCAKAVAGVTATPPPADGGTRGKWGELSFYENARDTFHSMAEFGEWIFSGFDSEVNKDVAKRRNEEYGKVAAGIPIVSSVFNGYSVEAVPNPGAAMTIGTRLALANRAQLLTGFPTDYLMQHETYLYQFANPQYIPSQAELNSAFLANVVTSEQWRCLTMAQGNVPEGQRWVLQSNQTQPGIPDLLTLWLRGQVSQTELSDRLRKLGVIDSRKVEDYRKLAHQLPTPSDAIRLAVRDVFDPKKLGRAEMLEELQQQVGLKELFDAVGLRKTSITSVDGKPFEIDNLLWYWMASYEECSPTQVYEMLHRLRPNRTHLYPLPDGKGGTATPEPVTMPIVNSLLKEKDYNPIWRKRLAAISYRPMGRIDVKNLYKRRGFGPPLGLAGFNLTAPGKPKAVGTAEIELVERFQDMGYTETDAQLQAYDAAASMDATRGLKGRTRQLAIICRQYQQGAIDKSTAITQTAELVGGREEAERLVLICDAEGASRDFSAAIGGVKRAYLSGEINRQTAMDRLRRVGVVGVKIPAYLTTWDFILQKRTKEVTADGILNWYRQRIIDSRSARDRLENLGYRPEDATRMVRIVDLGELARSAKEAERLRKARDAAQRRQLSAAERAIKERETSERRALLRFLSAYPDKNLKTYWKDGTITVAEIRDVLTLKGWDGAAIDRWLISNDPNKGVGDAEG